MTGVRLAAVRPRATRKTGSQRSASTTEGRVGALLRPDAAGRRPPPKNLREPRKLLPTVARTQIVRLQIDPLIPLP